MTNNEKTLLVLLNKIAEENGYQNDRITLKEITSGGANYTSKLYTAVIREPNKDDLYLFAKLAAIGEQYRAEMPGKMFDTERFVYTDLLKAYHQLEEENNVAEKDRLQVPKFYGCDPTLYQEAIVLENLVAHGYQSFDRFQPMDWQYASAAVQELAKFHALSFAYRNKYPKEFENTLALMKMPTDVDAIEGFMRSPVETALKTVKPEYREALAEFLKQNFKDIMEYYSSPVDNPVLVHGDYRGSNLLHRVREDGNVDIKIVDLQTVQGGSPIMDLMYFIFTGTDEKFRARYYDKLVEHYFVELVKAMTRLHLDPETTYCRNEFLKDIKEKLRFGLGIAVSMLPVLTVESENAPTLDEHLQLSNFTVTKTSNLYEERLNGVVNDFVKWGVLK